MASVVASANPTSSYESYDEYHDAEPDAPIPFSCE